jgi:integrase
VDIEVEEANRRYPRLRVMVLRDAAIVRLMLFTDLRVGEIVLLRLSNIAMVVREEKETKDPSFKASLIIRALRQILFETHKQPPN